MLTDMLTDIFGEEYTLERFSLSRIDCCVNVMLSKNFSSERYVKLISRSLNCKRDMIEEYDGDDELSKNRNKHSFRVRTSFGAFTAYDKYFQLEDKKRNFNNISDALLRIELMYLTVSSNLARISSIISALYSKIMVSPLIIAPKN